MGEGLCQGGYGTYGFAGLLISQLTNLIVKELCDRGGPHIYPEDRKLLLSEYDFIIVGAGSAGSVVANRLSEISSVNVLLVEAGGDPTAASDIPRAMMSFDQDILDWGYYSEIEPGVCEGYENIILSLK